MNEQALKTVLKFEGMPETEEKNEICRKYLSDEIGPFEFACLASEYIDRQDLATAEG